MEELWYTHRVISLEEAAKVVTQTTRRDCASRLEGHIYYVCTLDPGHTEFTIDGETWDHASHGSEAVTIWREA